MAGPIVNRSDAEDREMVAAILSGSQPASRALIRKHEKLVMSIVFKMVQQREDREDLCQDIFLAVFHKLETFRFQAKLSTWIGRIAYHRCLNFLEKKKTVLLEDIAEGSNETAAAKGQGQQLIADHDRHPEQVLLDKELGQKILAAMEKLPVIQKVVISLFHQAGLPLEEIAIITGLPVNTVKSHLFRGRKALKAQLEKM